MILLNFAKPIKGSCAVQKYEGWINLETVEFAVSRSISDVGNGKDRDTSNPGFTYVRVTKSADIASPDLFMQAVCGASLGLGKIHFVQTGGDKVKGGQPFLKIELGEVLIASYDLSSSGERPSETILLGYTTISYQYDAFNGETVQPGTPKCWNLLQHLAI